MFPPRSLEFYTAALERASTRDRLREHGFKVVLDYSYGAASLVDAGGARQARRRGARGEPVREHRGRDRASKTAARAVARIGELVRASGSHLGMVIDPDGETADDRRRRGHGALDTEQALLALVSLVVEATERARIALPGVGQP